MEGVAKCRHAADEKTWRRFVKVTFVLPHAGLHGGIRVCAIYAAHLHARGHDVTVVSTPKRDLTWIAKAKNFVKGAQWKFDLRGPSHFDNVPVKHHVVDRFRPIVDSDLPDADIVIATWWETAEWVASLAPSKGVKCHMIQHDETQMSNQQIERIEATWKLPLQRIVVARWLAELGRTRYGVNNIQVIPNGVNPKQFFAPPREKQRQPTIGMMFSSVYFKGCDVALEAFRIAHRNIPSLKLVGFGMDEPRGTMAFPDDSEFHLSPRQDKLRELYASCDAWLFASRSEGFGLPLLEAMACRTPVIATPAGAAPELINEGGGILVKPQDPIDMAIAIERIARMPREEWRDLSAAAARTAGNHTWDNSADQFERVLRDILSLGKAA
jgi:glycosyltransferase involved in cell wall biosynthesis